MTRRTWPLLLAGLLVLAATADLRAQVEGQAVTLAFQHQAGKIRKYRLTSKSDLVMSPQGAGGGGGLGPIPLELKTNMQFTEKVAGVKDGKGTLTVTPLALVADTAVMGMNMQMKMEGGKVLLNGQPVPPDAGLGPMAAMLSDQPVIVRRDARGRIETDAAPNASLGQLLGSSYLVQFPEGPVKVGDTWESTMQMPGGAPAGVPLPVQGAALEVKLTHTLKALETVAGRLIAVIESTGQTPGLPAPEPAPAPAPGEAPGGVAPTPEGTTYSGLTRFDVAQGAIVGGKYGTQIRLSMPLGGLLGGGAPGGAPGAAAPGLPDGIRIEGSMAFDLGELPYVAPAAKPAPKPAAKPTTKPAPKPAPKVAPKKR